MSPRRAAVLLALQRLQTAARCERMGYARGAAYARTMAAAAFRRAARETDN